MPHISSAHSLSTSSRSSFSLSLSSSGSLSSSSRVDRRASAFSAAAFAAATWIAALRSRSFCRARDLSCVIISDRMFTGPD